MYKLKLRSLQPSLLSSLLQSESSSVKGSTKGTGTGTGTIQCCRMDAPRKKRFEILRDGTGKLSDDILCYILSLLSLREAARTSILSCRWRYLWRSHIKLSRSLSLDFLAMKGCSTSRSLSLYRGHNYWKRSTLQIQSNRFIKWADEILQLGHNCGIDSFRLRFYMNRNQSHLVDSWINAAIHSKVQNIDIDLSHFAVGVDSPSQAMLYTFPCGRLFTQKTGSLVKCLHLSSCVLECVNCYLFSSLVELRLKKVPINWENMARLLSNCPNLENLSLVQCPMLDRVEISGQCKKLKYLTLYGVNMLKIDSAELTRLELRGTPKILSLENTPRLSDVRMNFMGQNVPESYLEILSKGATKLDSLLLVVHNSKGMKIPSRLSSFMNLKKLLLKVAGIKETLWGFTSLIQSCPHLEKLEIHMFNTAEECRSGKKLFDFLQLHLKEVVFTCFRGTRHEMEFIESLVSHSPALEKVSIGYKVRHYDNKGGFYVLDILAKYYHMWSDSKKRESEILAARSACEKKYMEEQAPVLFAKILPAGVKLNFL